MNRLILHIYDWLSARKGLAALFLILALLLCLLAAMRLSFQEDISAFLPQEQRETLGQTAGQERLAVLFQGGTLEEKLDAMDAFEAAWTARYPEAAVLSADGPDVQDVFSFLCDNVPYFLTDADYRRMDSLLQDPELIPRRLQEGKKALYSAMPFQTRYFRADPLGLYTPLLQRLQRAGMASRMEEGRLFTADGACGILFVDSPYGGSESGENARLVRGLDSLKARTSADFPSLTITSTGGPEVAVENASRIRKDSFLALALAAILICIVLWFSYKRLWDVLWILLSIGAGAVFALGFISLFKSSVSVIVLGIGCTVIGIAVNYPLHYVDHLKYQKDKRKALADQVNPLLVGNITTVGAFLSLLLTKADALHDFGFIGAMMLVGTIVFVMLFLPVFMPQGSGARRTLKLDLDRYWNPSPASRKAVFLAFLALTILFSIWGSRVGFDANMHHINYMTPAQEEGFAVLESLQPDASAFPLPSDEEQTRRLAQWQDLWQRHADVPLRLAQESARAGYTPQAFRPFLDAVEKEWTPQPRSYFAPVDFATSETGFANALVASLSQDFDRLGLICGLIVFLFLVLSFGRLELAILAFLPLAVSWIWIGGIMGLTGLSFNIVNMILATFIFGMGDDYTIFITEGLLYERATGKQILHSFKNAVVLSALIMFIGIGTLVTARHPAMRSLGLVTVIGMLTVVVMACYLPPLVLRFLTTRHGKERRQPLTLGNMLSTAWMGSMFGLAMGLMSAWAAVYFLLGDNERKRAFYHRVIQRISRLALKLIPGAPFTVHNPTGEDFSRPAIYICNHQSHLDVLGILSLHPKLVCLTNEWAWKFYGPVIRKADFYPASMVMENDFAHIRALIARGYSVVIFPEGTRSEDCHIQRFHQGAFLLARALGLEVLPLYLHGFGQALPKHDFLLRSAPLYLEVGKRIPVPETGDIKAFTREVRHQYQQVYGRIVRERETAAWCARFVRYRYLYKGHDAQAELRRVLRPAVYAQVDALQGESLTIPEAGCGVYALLVALTHPDMQVTAREKEEEKYLTAIRCQDFPDNLHYVLEKDQ